MHYVDITEDRRILFRNFVDASCITTNTPTTTLLIPIMNTYLRFFDYEAAYVYYCDLISRMRQNRKDRNQPKRIAKPALILAIIKLIEDGKTVNRFDYDELEPIYKSIFGHFFVLAHQDNLTPMCNPFYYLRTDRFWQLVWTNAEVETNSPSAAWIRRNVKYGCIDRDLWLLLSHETYRNRMKEYIIEDKVKNVSDSEGKCLLKTLLHLLMVV